MPLHEEHGPVPDEERDGAVRREVEQRLGDELLGEAEDITVEVTAGRVTLRGDVSGPEVLRRASAVCRGIDGVEHVENLLRPRRIVPTTH